MPSIDLVAFDLDGTVFARPTELRTSERVERALACAHDVGVIVAVASGRPAWMLGDQLRSAPWLDWRVLTNGARVSPSDAGEPDHVSPIDRTRALEVIDALRDLGGGVSIHTQRASFYELRKATLFAERRAAEEGTAPGNPIDAMVGLGDVETIDSVPDLLAKDPALVIDKFDCTLPDVIAAARAREALANAHDIEVAWLKPDEVEVSAKGVSKGAAIGWLCDHLGIDESHAVAFGDSGNDLSLTGRALTFVAMGNASKEVAAAADDRCPTVQEDGVAVWLEEHLA